MANRKGLGESRKFANGTVHENGTGTFVILNRYEGEDGKPQLEFQWQTGVKAGDIESNSEQNVNSAIHKFQTTRRAQQNTNAEPLNIKHGFRFGGSVMEMLDEAYKIAEENNTIMRENTILLTQLLENVAENTRMIRETQKVVIGLTDFVTTYNERQYGIKGVIEEQGQLISGLKVEIDRLIDRAMLFEKQQEMMNSMSKQQEMMLKMVDKRSGGVTK